MKLATVNMTEIHVEKGDDVQIDINVSPTGGQALYITINGVCIVRMQGKKLPAVHDLRPPQPRELVEGREVYAYGTKPDGWEFIPVGQKLVQGNKAYHVSDSTYIDCAASIGRTVEQEKHYIRSVEE